MLDISMPSLPVVQCLMAMDPKIAYIRDICNGVYVCMNFNTLYFYFMYFIYF